MGSLELATVGVFTPRQSQPLEIRDLFWLFFKGELFVDHVPAHHWIVWVSGGTALDLSADISFTATGKKAGIWTSE